MIATAEPKRKPPTDDRPAHGSESPTSADLLYCRDCRKYHRRDAFIQRENGLVICRRCHEERIGVDHARKAQEWLRKIVSHFIDREVEQRADAESISSLSFAKSFYGEFGGPAEAGSEIGAYFKDLMRDQPNSSTVAGKLVTMMRLMVQIEGQHQASDELPSTKEELIAHMQTLAMRAVNQAMRAEAAKNLAQAAEFLSENMPIAELSHAFEDAANEVAHERNLPALAGPLDVK